jgi:hypothetical protein
LNKLELKLWSKLIISTTSFYDSTPCLEWAGYITEGGYGTLWNGKTAYVHRTVYEMLMGPIPKKLQLDHLCRNRRCANVLHLEAVTSRENTMRGKSRQAENAIKTHCKHGHEFTPENTYITGKGSRQCKECKNNTMRKIRGAK